jgi:hypothetical protein
MPTLTRRHDIEAPDECWHVYYGNVRVGTIAKRAGIPFDKEPWGWACGFYPGSHPRECTNGVAVTFEEARAEFEEAWAVFPSNRTDADFAEWRHQWDWTAQKYAMWERGEKLPSQRPNKMTCCPCGEAFDSHRLEHTVIHVPHISAANTRDGIRRWSLVRAAEPKQQQFSYFLFLAVPHLQPKLLGMFWSILAWWASGAFRAKHPRRPKSFRTIFSKGTDGLAIREIDYGAGFPIRLTIVESAQMITPLELKIRVRNADPNWGKTNNVIHEAVIIKENPQTDGLTRWRVIDSVLGDGTEWVKDGILKSVGKPTSWEYKCRNAMSWIIKAGNSRSKSARMKDKAIVTAALNEAGLIVEDYLQPGRPQDPVATIKRLIEVLEDQELLGAIKRLEKGLWLRAVEWVRYDCPCTSCVGGVGKWIVPSLKNRLIGAAALLRMPIHS